LRGGKGGKVFLGPATFGGPCLDPTARHRSKILNRVFQVASFWPQICIIGLSIFGRGSTPDPAGGAYDATQTPSRMVRGHPSPRFLCLDALGVSISAHNEVVIGPRDNVFPGSTVALDGRARTWLILYVKLCVGTFSSPQ